MSDDVASGRMIDTTAVSGPGRRALLLGTAGLGALACGSALTGGAGVLPAWADETGTRRQSPIDIRTRAVVDAPRATPLVVDYPTRVDLDLAYVTKDEDDEDDDDGCGVRGEDETVQANNFSEPAVVRRGGEVWRLLQTHFHISSEHRVDGRSFPMEQHLVHQRDSDGALLVVGVLLLPGGHGPQDRLLATLPEECDDDPVQLRGINLAAMLPGSLASWTYRGSLTTPPYTQGVTWHVMRDPRRIEAATIRRFQRLFVEGDSRPPQPRNGRTVRLVRGRRAR